MSLEMLLGLGLAVLIALIMEGRNNPPKDPSQPKE